MLSLPSGRTEKTPGLVQKDPLWFQRKGQRQKRWASEYCKCCGLCYLGQTRKQSLRLRETFGGFPQSGKVLDGVELVISSLYGPWTERVNSFWPYIFQRKDLLTSSVASSSSSSQRLPPLPVPAFWIHRKAVTRASDPIISHTILSPPPLLCSAKGASSFPDLFIHTLLSNVPPYSYLSGPQNTHTFFKALACSSHVLNFPPLHENGNTACAHCLHRSRMWKTSFCQCWYRF